MNLSGILFFVGRAARFALGVCAVYAVVRTVWLRVKRERIDWKRELVWLAFVLYFAALCEIIALRGGAGDARSAQLVPLRTTLRELRAGAWAFAYHVVGNMIWFVPLGIFAHRKGAVRAILIGAGVSVGLEILQWLLMTGVTDVDDVILNALGALAGCIIWKLMNKMRGKTRLI